MAVKAIVQVLEGKQKGKKYKVLFNPNTYTVEQGNQYKYKPINGLSVPLVQFANGTTPKLSMELFFDCSDKGFDADVREFTAPFVSLLDVDSELHAPPLCQFVWGSLLFKGYLESLTQKYTMFSVKGNPIRARFNVTFKGVSPIKEQLQQTPRHSPDRTKEKTLKQGDQLWMISAEEYEDPKHWRAIADVNNIDNPRTLKPGRRLVVPRLE